MCGTEKIFLQTTLKISLQTTFHNIRLGAATSKNEKNLEIYYLELHFGV